MGIPENSSQELYLQINMFLNLKKMLLIHLNEFKINKNNREKIKKRYLSQHKHKLIESKQCVERY